MLHIEHLTKKFGNKTAVDDLTVHLAPGQICAFIGHNGAGKTTTLKACCGIHDFDEGQILINGHSIKEEPLVCKRDLAYLPDNPDLYEFMSGSKYLNFISDIFRIPQDVRKQRIAKYAEMLSIYQDLSQPISSYSHGMKQKIAIISALVHDPKLLLMDEPFVGLDPVASHDLKNVMHDLCSRGASIFYSTHVLEVAEKLCDRVVIIKGGRLVASGTMDEVLGDSSLESVFLELEGAQDA